MLANVVLTVDPSTTRNVLRVDPKERRRDEGLRNLDLFDDISLSEFGLMKLELRTEIESILSPHNMGVGNIGVTMGSAALKQRFSTITVVPEDDFMDRVLLSLCQEMGDVIGYERALNVALVQQSVQGLHRVRLMLIRQRTQLANAIRGHMAEYGLVAPVGRNGLAQLVNIITDTDDDRVPETIRSCLAMLVAQLGLVNRQILETDRRVAADARASETGRRLMEVPGVGPVLASAIVAAVPDPKAFKSGRNLAAWIGLVPRQNSSGGRKRLGGITKQGDRYLRQLLVVGALSVVRQAMRHGTRRSWLVQLLARRTPKIAAVALANKTARIIWAMMTTGDRYREPQSI